MASSMILKTLARVRESKNGAGRAQLEKSAKAAQRAALADLYWALDDEESTLLLGELEDQSAALTKQAANLRKAPKAMPADSDPIKSVVKDVEQAAIASPHPHKLRNPPKKAGR